jgi:hypothetical protein
LIELCAFTFSRSKTFSPARSFRQAQTLDARLAPHLDTFVKTDGEWLFAERKLYVDWLEQRELS